MADRLIGLCCGLCLALTAFAEDEEVPDGEFLEYLGMWEESDEEWLLFEEMRSDSFVLRNDEPRDESELPEDEESPEKEDES